MHLTAVRHQKTFAHGHSRPMLIDAEEVGEGTRHEIVLKLAPSVQSGRTGLAIEAICAELALKLGLNAARGWSVEITPEFASSVPDSDARRRLGLAVGVQFGSTYHAGQYHVPLADGMLSDSLIDQAAAIMLFDALIGNDDRHRTKPNCLLRGDGIVLIDHERALPVLRSELRPAAWECGGLDMVRNHVFLHGLRGQMGDFSGAAQAWRAITPTVAAEVVNAVPGAWLDELGRMKAIGFVVEMAAKVDNVAALLKEMTK